MTNVAIVGAGCAGLGAAATLLEKSNANVWIYEALGRIGGRTWTYSDSLPVDLGAEALEDPADNPWVAIANTLGIQLTDAEQTTMYRVLQEQIWSSETDNPGIALVDATLEQGYTLRRDSPNLPIIGSLHDWGETPPQMVSLALASSPLGPIKESAEPWQFIAADMNRQEASEEDGGPPKFVAGGVGGLVNQYADWLQETYGERLRIIPNSPVAAINCESGNLVLTTEEAVASDYCIVTVPVSSILRIAFTPPLSYGRIVAYRNLKLGSYKKIGFRPTTPPTDGAAIAPGKLYYAYDPVLEGSWQYSWLPTDPTVLVCVASGNFAARLDWMADDEVLTALLQLLGQAHAGGDFTPQPGPDQKPAVAISNWTRQSYIRGAYSYTVYDGGPPDDVEPLAARDWIAKPDERAYFAGEATWADNYGTIAGAYLSGERAAKRLIADRSLPAPD